MNHSALIAIQRNNTGSYRGFTISKNENKWYSGIPVLSNDRVRLFLTLVLSVYLFVSSLEGVKHGFKLIFSEWQGSILT